MLIKVKKKGPKTVQEIIEEKLKTGELHPQYSHKIVTRRDFLASGIIPFAAYMMAPTIGSILWGRHAHAACATDDGTGIKPMAFMQLNLRGGSPIHASWIMKDQNGGFLGNYDRLGMGSRSNFDTTLNTNRNNTNRNDNPNEFGISDGFFQMLAGNQDTAGFLRGWRSIQETFATLAANSPLIGAGETADTAAVKTFLSRVASIQACGESRDDTGANPMLTLGDVEKAGLVGEKLSVVAEPGLNHMKTFADVSPVPVTRYEDFEAALGPKGALAALAGGQKRQLFEFMKKLNDSEAKRLVNRRLAGSEQLLNDVGCATDKNAELAKEVANPTKYDPGTNAAFRTIFNIQAGQNTGSENYVFATLLYNALSGNCGAVGFELSGHDGHNGTRTNMDTRTFEVGQFIGRAFAAAAYMHKPLAILLTSDGSMEGPANPNHAQFVWTNDNGGRAANILLVYKPEGRPTYHNNALGFGTEYQIGWFGQGQEAVGEQFIAGWSDPKRQMAALLVNWLAASGLATRAAIQGGDGGVSGIFPRNYFSEDQLKRILKLASYGSLS